MPKSARAAAVVFTLSASLPALAADDTAAPQSAVAPDNTAVNKVDLQKGQPTADSQSNAKSDVKLAAEIRRSIMKDKTLSTNGHNVKIIAQNGSVTLKGPVKTAEEKATIEQKAVQIAGQDKVTSQLSVKQ